MPSSCVRDVVTSSDIGCYVDGIHIQCMVMWNVVFPRISEMHGRRNAIFIQITIQW